MDVSLGQLFQCAEKIRQAESVLGPLTPGQKSDLLLDNFDWIPNSVLSHEIIKYLSEIDICDHCKLPLESHICIGHSIYCSQKCADLARV